MSIADDSMVSKTRLESGLSPDYFPCNLSKKRGDSIRDPVLTGVLEAQ